MSESPVVPATFRYVDGSGKPRERWLKLSVLPRVGDIVNMRYNEASIVEVQRVEWTLPMPEVVIHCRYVGPLPARRRSVVPEE
jgi:hypothetical protein